MGDLVFSGAELGVGLRIALGDEDRVPAETLGAPGLMWDLSLHLPGEDAHGITGSDSDGADGPGGAVLLVQEHLEETCAPDGGQDPLRQRPRQAVPGSDDEPRILDQYGRVRG